MLLSVCDTNGDGLLQKEEVASCVLEPGKQGDFIFIKQAMEHDVNNDELLDTEVNDAPAPATAACHCTPKLTTSLPLPVPHLAHTARRARRSSRQ